MTKSIRFEQTEIETIGTKNDESSKGNGVIFKKKEKIYPIYKLHFNKFYPQANNYE